MNFTTRFLFLTALTALVAAPGCTSKSKNDLPNTLHLFAIEKIKGLDPILAEDQYAGDEVGRVYDTLLQYSYLKRPFQLEPSLAEAMPTISADGLTYTIKIKKGVVFQDDPCFKATNGKGREMVAEDLIYSFKRVADPKLNSPGFWIFDGKILGLNEWREAAIKAGTTDYSSPVAGLAALDHYTLVMKLTSRSAQMLNYLAMPFASAVPKEAVDTYDKDFIGHPVGTGPFKLVEYNPASKVVWAKNPTYRPDFYPTEGEPADKAAGLLADAGKPLPLAERVVVDIYIETQPQWLNFLAGKLDYTVIPKDNFGQATVSKTELTPELKAKGLALDIVTAQEVTHETFNMLDPVVGKNKLLRQALSLAIDKEKFNELFYNGRAIAAQTPIPPGLGGYDPNYKNPYRQFNLEKAKELLAKAGFPGGQGLAPIDVISPASSLDRQINEFYEKSFAAIGVKMKVDSYTWPEFLASIKNHKGQMWGWAWLADYPDAENFLQQFYSKNVSPGPNDANYINPEFDKLYEKSLTLADSPARSAIYKEMAMMVVEDAPWIYSAHRLTYHLRQPWLKNYKINEYDHGRSKYYRIDETLKK